MFTLAILSTIFTILALAADWYTSAKGMNNNINLDEGNYLLKKLAELLKQNPARVVGTVLGLLIVGYFYVMITLGTGDPNIVGVIFSAFLVGLPHTWAAIKNYRILKSKGIM